MENLSTIKMILDKTNNSLFLKLGKLVQGELNFTKDTIIEPSKPFYLLPIELESKGYLVFTGNFVNKQTGFLKKFDVSISERKLIVYDAVIKDYYPSKLYPLYICK